MERPFFKSCLYYSADAGAIRDALMRGFNVVVIVDAEEINLYPACYSMSSLLPPYELVSMILNTDRQDPNYNQILQTYIQSYGAFLANPRNEGHIVNLIASMYKTTRNTLLFAEYDVERQFYPLYILRSFFITQFGINILPYESLFNSNTQLPVLNPSPEYIYRIIDLLFTNAFITKEEYAVMLPPGIVPSPRSIQILLSDCNYAFPTMEAAITAACNLIDSYRMQAQTGITFPVVQLTKALDETRAQQIQKLINDSNTKFGKQSLSQLQARNPVIGNFSK